MMTATRSARGTWNARTGLRRLDAGEAALGGMALRWALDNRHTF